MKRTLVMLVGALAIVFVAVQLVPVDRNNPPVVADFDGPADVESVLRTSCYDCHSHEVRWPWYSRVAPASWLVAHDVREARDHLNFSKWEILDAKHRAKMAEEMWEEVEERQMPLPMYLLAHPDARLTETAKATLRRWSVAAAESDD